MRRCLEALLLSGLLLATLAPTLHADPAVYVRRGSMWKYLRGLAEASSPVTAWRQRTFSDGSWQQGRAPFGYGDPPLGTDLAAQTPAMQNNYTTVFLRQTFDVADPSSVVDLQVDVDYDDGFILWINGLELLRVNVPGQKGDAVTYQGVAAGNHESGTYENFDELPPPATILVAGTNVVAVQGFNVHLPSSDFKLDLELFDPFGPDLTPPGLVGLVPAPGVTVRSLGQVEVTFSEVVAGVDAADLLVDGLPAAAVSGAGAGPYVFSFAPRDPGSVEVSWAPGHGIADLGQPPNPFAAGSSWTYTVDPAAPVGDLVISEFLASNRAGLRDEDGDPEDWIEVRNVGTIAVDVSGWGVTDDADELGKWTLPQRNVGPGQSLLIFASGKDRRPPTGNLHTNFKLNSASEYLALTSPDSPRRVVFEYAPGYPEQRPDVSFGLTGTGQQLYFENPTPGSANVGGVTYSGLVSLPEFQPERGFFSAPISVAITSRTAGARIYYTLDGSEPGPGNGTLYSGPLDVAGTDRRGVVTIRAAAFRSGLLASASVSSTYIFPEKVLRQPANPGGFPGVWGSHPSVDYAMDPEIVNSPRYSDQIQEGLLSIPTISIVMEVDDMFGSRGIYSNPGGTGISWERPTSVEFIYPDGRGSEQINCGIRIQGGASRNVQKSAKHSLRLLFKGAYGPTRLRMRFFEDTPVDSFDTITLRGGFNNSWMHWNGTQRSRAQFLRDQFARDTQRDMGQVTSHGNFMHVYINGLYWGLYNPVERPSAPFAASYFGGEKEEYDAYNSAAAIDGTGQSWNTLMSRARADLSSMANYRALADFLDLEAFADYMMINIYGSNGDWPSHNWYGARRQQSGARFRFFSWDAERILEGVTANKTGVSTDNSPGIIYSRLRANPEFRLLFADRLHRHFFNGGALTPEAVRARWLARASETELAQICESARWGDYRRDVFQWRDPPYELYTLADHWLPERSRLITSYFPRRSGTVLNQFRSIGLYPSVGAPIFSQHGGTIEPGYSLVMSLPAGTAGTIYYTTDGSDPRVPVTGAVSTLASPYGGPVVLDDRAHIRARTLGGGTWSALAEATFTLPAQFESLHISEIHYHPPLGSGAEFIELHNSGNITIELMGMRFSNGIDFTFAGNRPLAPGEHLVLVADPVAFAAEYPGVAIGGTYDGRLANGGEKVTLRDPRARTIISVDYSDAGFWPLSPDGLGHSLVLADPGGDPDDPRSWRASSEVGGSPGAADPEPQHGGILVNEILTHGVAPFEDAIELFNPTGQAIAIGGWYLSDSRADAASLRKFSIPPGTVIPAGGHRVFYEFQFSAPGGPGSFALDPAGGEVYLASADSSRNLTGHVVGHRFAGAASGVSLGRHVTTTGQDLVPLARPTFGVDNPTGVENFRTGTGAANSEPLVGPVVLNEVHYHPVDGLPEFIELFNLTSQTLELHDAGLGRGWRLEGVTRPDRADSFEFGPGAVIPARGFLLLVPTDPALFRSLANVPAAVPVVGPYGGALDNGGERLKLLRPDRPAGGAVTHILVDQVRFNDRAPWPLEPDGSGPSLERIQARSYGNEPLGWDASAVAGGSPGRINSVSPPPDTEPPVARFTVTPGAGTAPLRVVFDASGSADPDGQVVSFEWTFGDGTRGIGEIVDHTFIEPGTYTIALRVTDDRGAEGTAAGIVTAEAPDLGGRQIPADCNQDGVADISDAICLLVQLFIGSAQPLPCDGGIAEGGNRTLLDINGDAQVNITDPVTFLVFLFRSGPAPVAGTSCIPIQGCPSVCR